MEEKERGRMTVKNRKRRRYRREKLKARNARQSTVSKGNTRETGKTRESDQSMEVLEKGEEEEHWRVLEFYSGIGGMRYSIQKAGVGARIIEAFDINDVANDVYQHNFGHRPFQGNIQTLSAVDLDGYEAHAWLLSPPCQPYTRQGLQKGSDDARAFSFLQLLELIPQMLEPPLMLFLENVVGFEKSDTHKKMLETLKSIGFVTQEFILTPLQFGVPYSRPRYFCLAKRKPLSFLNPECNNQLLFTPDPLFGSFVPTMVDEQDRSNRDDELLYSCQPIESFLEFKSLGSEIKSKSKFFASNISISVPEALETVDQENVSEVSNLNQYFVPLKLIEKLGNAMDIVYPDSKRCCCFTKSYYRYVKGTGSLLATAKCIKLNANDKSSSLKHLWLRYFTPKEVANLHSFPADFTFPQLMSLRQRYALLGNSLSVAVVTPLLKYLFAEPP